MKTHRTGRVTCGADRCQKALAAESNARRRGAEGADRFLASDVFDRDGWVCWLCEGAVDETLEWPHPMCATMDHVVPVSKGEPTRWRT